MRGYPSVSPIGTHQSVAPTLSVWQPTLDNFSDVTPLQRRSTVGADRVVAGRVTLRVSSIRKHPSQPESLERFRQDVVQRVPANRTICIAVLVRKPEAQKRVHGAPLALRELGGDACQHLGGTLRHRQLAEML